MTKLTKQDRSKIAKRNRSRSYSNEKAVERLFKSRRVGTMGGEDAFNLLFSIEAKSRDNPPKAIEDWLQQAEENAPEGRHPLLYVHKTNRRREEDYVVLRVKSFKEVFDKLLELCDPNRIL